jgi:MATE family multidrug resistance protein
VSQPAVASPEISHRALVAIALPMTLGYVTTPLVGIFSMGAVGHLDDAALTAGVALGAIVTDVVFATCNFLRSGTTGLTAQAVGRGDGAEVRAVLYRALIVAAGIGVAILAALPLILWLAPIALEPGPAATTAMTAYLAARLVGAPLTLANFALFGWLIGRARARLGLVLITVANGLTIALSLTFVAGFGWGVAGAGAAPVIAELGALGLGIAIVAPELRRAGQAGGRIRLFDGPAIRAMLAVNRDIMIRSFVLLFAFAYFARVGASQGDVVLSANAILEKFFMLGGYFLDGVAAAAETFVGQAIGARHRASFDRAVRLSFLWNSGLALACSLALLAGGGVIVALMTTVEAVRDTAATYMLWAVATPIAGVAAFTFDGVYIGATWSRDMRNMMLISLALFLTAVAVLMPIAGNHGLWAAFLIFLGARGASLGLLMPRRAAAAFAPA